MLQNTTRFSHFARISTALGGMVVKLTWNTMPWNIYDIIKKMKMFGR